jgi:hypothetical protein
MFVTALCGFPEAVVSAQWTRKTSGWAVLEGGLAAALLLLGGLGRNLGGKSGMAWHSCGAGWGASELAGRIQRAGWDGREMLTSLVLWIQGCHMPAGASEYRGRGLILVLVEAPSRRRG